MRRGLATVALALATLPAAAKAPDTSLRPPRALPVAAAVEPAVAAPAVPATRPRARPEPVAAPVKAAPVRPRARPELPAAKPAEPVDPAAATEVTVTALAQSEAPRKQTAVAPSGPEPRSGQVEKRVSARTTGNKAFVCGDRDILGETVGRVTSENSACGIKDAVRVRSVSGVSLSQAALMNCPTAAALKKWVDKGLQPAMPRKDPVVRLQVAAHYACRGRNNQRGARISEHGKGNAIDISAFVLRSGKVLTVVKDYSRKGPLGVARRAACGIFGTVLGPGSDRYHSDHFHLDTARHRGGPYCR